LTLSVEPHNFGHHARDFVARRERRFGLALVLARDHQRVREAEADGVNAQTDAARFQRWRWDIADAESRRRTEAVEDECALPAMVTVGSRA